ncbi:hypothetical protein [Mesonia mobilis]|uniref:hypothetical protein n=1 Tax=Mesonia mobilis TaxID=369791 RepID=UPI0024B9C619|nr:hypothetical protein [Mesonia mobilis]|tara:strand:+ start:339 stop:812 length:474 start_codon:yes stop_codon:yes gene_type:complete
MKYSYLLLLLLCFGCQNFETKKISSEDLVEEELKELNWQEVEVYPAFEACENLSETQAKKSCFEQQFALQLHESLQQKKVILSDSIQEKMLLYISINANGKPSLDSLETSALIEEKMPQMQSWLQESIQKMPKIYPARKRGIPVKTSFKLPLVIASE